MTGEPIGYDNTGFEQQDTDTRFHPGTGDYVRTTFAGVPDMPAMHDLTVNHG